MSVHGAQYIPHRRFTQADLLAIDAILRNGPFDDFEWAVTDHQGTTRGADLAAILRNVFYESVQSFSVSARRDFCDYSTGVNLDAPANHIHLWLTHKLNVAWSGPPETRQPVELTYTRLIHFLDQLPVNPGYTSRFTDTSQPQPEPEPEPKPQRHWWNPVRAPRSIIDWVAVAVIAAFAVSAIGALVLLISKMF
jgi:hypothetical protein